VRHPNPFSSPTIVIEKSETSRRHIGALQTVAKLLEPSAYFDFYENTSSPATECVSQGRTFFNAAVTEAVTGALLRKAA
jgi:hypothetical protein